MNKIKNIAYFGFADAPPSDPLFKEAFELSKYLTSKGYTSVNGGGPGAMRAVSEGAKAAGGTAIGVTFYPKDITNFEGRDPKNPFDQEIVCKSYLERTLKLLELGDAYVVFRGGTGTISEFGMAWGLARLYFGHHKPLILYGDFWYKIMQTFGITMRIRSDDLKVYRIVNSPEEAYQALQIFDEVIAPQKNPSSDERAFELVGRGKG
ncbi:LOG family protein [Candidatus Woesebacteria bacterium]|nr:LOG family protein [Candidatus Woesebacteria bacterium]QQG47591.1 MAG: LOG family protein [Candidatus Woesebacteria bacterium]